MESHLLALRALIEPWVNHHDSERERHEAIQKHLYDIRFGLALHNASNRATET